MIDRSSLYPAQGLLVRHNAGMGGGKKPENEVWDYIADFESDYFVGQFTEKRIATILKQNPPKA